MAAEKIKRMGLKRDGGLLYIDASGKILRRKPHTAGPEDTGARLGVREAGFLYFVDKDGDLARARRK